MNTRSSDIQMASHTITTTVKEIHEYIDESAQKLLDRLYALNGDDISYLTLTQKPNGSLFAQANNRIVELRNIVQQVLQGIERDFGVANNGSPYQLNANRTIVLNNNGTTTQILGSPQQRSIILAGQTGAEEFISTIDRNGSLVLSPVKSRLQTVQTLNGTQLIYTNDALIQSQLHHGDILGQTVFSAHPTNTRVRTTYLNTTVLQGRSPDRKENSSLQSLVNQRMLAITKVIDGNQVTIYGVDGLPEFSEKISVPRVGQITGKFSEQLLYSQD